MQLLGSLLRSIPVVDCILEDHIKARLASIFPLPGWSYWRRELDVRGGHCVQPLTDRSEGGWRR